MKGNIEVVFNEDDRTLNDFLQITGRYIVDNVISNPILSFNFSVLYRELLLSRFKKA